MKLKKTKINNMPDSISNTDSNILEDLEIWSEKYRSGFLSKFKESGLIDWQLYNPPKNQLPITSAGIDPAKSRLMLISSAGGYLTASQKPFKADNPLGDYSIRELPTFTQFDELSYAHDHYDHTAVNLDPQVLLPLNILDDMVEQQTIGELSSIVSFMGYLPDAARVVNETIPAILEIARKENIDAAFLVPA